MAKPAAEVAAAVPRRLIAYGAGLLVLAVATPAFLLLEAQHQASLRQWQAKITQTRAANDAAEQRARAIWTRLYRSGRGEEPTSAEAAQALGSAASLPYDGEVAYADSHSGGTVFLHFTDGRWMMTTAASWSQSMPHGPPEDTTYEIAGVLRRLACIVAYLICGLLLLLVAGDWRQLDRRGRRLVSIDLMAAFVFLFGLSMLGPQPGRAWSAFFQDDSGGWGLLGAGVALLLVIASLIPRRRPVDRNLCRRCRYDLTGNMSGVCPECGTAR